MLIDWLRAHGYFAKPNRAPIKFVHTFKTYLEPWQNAIRQVVNSTHAQLALATQQLVYLNAITEFQLLPDCGARFIPERAHTCTQAHKLIQRNSDSVNQKWSLSAWQYNWSWAIATKLAGTIQRRSVSI